MTETEVQVALNRHWAASDAYDFDLEHDIYCDDAIVECRQSGERICGRRAIQASRVAQPRAKRFAAHRIVGRFDLWVTEFILTYDGRPSYSMSVMASWTSRWSVKVNTSAIRSSRDHRVRIWLG